MNKLLALTLALMITMSQAASIPYCTECSHVKSEKQCTGVYFKFQCEWKDSKCSALSTTATSATGSVSTSAEAPKKCSEKGTTDTTCIGFEGSDLTQRCYLDNGACTAVDYTKACDTYTVEGKCKLTVSCKWASGKCVSEDCSDQGSTGAHVLANDAKVIYCKKDGDKYVAGALTDLNTEDLCLSGNQKVVTWDGKACAECEGSMSDGNGSLWALGSLVVLYGLLQ